MNAVAWSYASDGTPYVVAEMPFCHARLGMLHCFEPEGHDGDHRTSAGNLNEAFLWLNRAARIDGSTGGDDA